MGCGAEGTHLIIGCGANGITPAGEVRILTEVNACLITLWVMGWT